MKNKRKMTLYILLAVTGILGTLLGTSCGFSSPQSPKTVVDYFGREISIPEKVERVVPIYYVLAEYICAIGARDKIVGIGLVYTNNYLLERFCPAVYEVPEIGRGGLNLEALVALQPDVVICSNSTEMIDSIENLGIVAFGTFPNTIESIFQQIQDTGVIVGKEEQAGMLVDFQKSRLEYVTSRTRDLGDDERPTVYYMREEFLETMGQGILSDIITLAGGKNVAEDLGESGRPVMVSLENVYQWNPEIIIIRDRSQITAEDVYADPAWQGIKAVRTQRIYKEHSGWTEFRTETIFGIMEKAKWFQPALFDELDVDAEYKQFLDLIASFYE
jgi:iron complex transport system substrate-binding protein